MINITIQYTKLDGRCSGEGLFYGYLHTLQWSPNINIQPVIPGFNLLNVTTAT